MAKNFPKRNYAPRVKSAESAPEPAAGTSWERQAGWYDQLQGEGGGDFYSRLILPAVLRQLDARPGQRVLDICCGQGVVGRALAAHQVSSVGVDASPSLVEAAKGRAGAFERHLVGDCRELGAALAAGGVSTAFDHATLVMALQDLDPIAPVLAGAAAAIKPGGRVVMAMTHPGFRIPRRSSWGFDDDNGIQYRRIDGYMSPTVVPIKTHPGRPADPSRTTSFHRPLSAYLSACGAAGLGVVAAEELCSHRRGTKGPRFGAEDRAAREFPLFIVLAALRIA